MSPTSCGGFDVVVRACLVERYTIWRKSPTPSRTHTRSRANQRRPRSSRSWCYVETSVEESPVVTSQDEVVVEHQHRDHIDQDTANHRWCTFWGIWYLCSLWYRSRVWYESRTGTALLIFSVQPRSLESPELVARVFYDTDMIVCRPPDLQSSHLLRNDSAFEPRGRRGHSDVHSKLCAPRFSWSSASKDAWTRFQRRPDSKSNNSE